MRLIVKVVQAIFGPFIVILMGKRTRGNIYISEPQMMTLHLTQQQVK